MPAPDGLHFEMRTWADVRTHDTVRLPSGDTARVVSAIRQDWHVDPRSSEYRPVPLEHTVVHVVLDVGSSEPRHYDMDPSKPIEIGIDKDTYEALLNLMWGMRP